MLPLQHRSSLYREALSRLNDVEQSEPNADQSESQQQEESLEQPLSLNDPRHGAVLAELRASGAHTVLDLGCGEGKLLRELFKDKQFEQRGISAARAVNGLTFEQITPRVQRAIRRNSIIQ